MDRVARARAYYRALDEHDYDALVTLLAPDFVHDRPDRTLTGRGRFVEFMREERPQTDTSHPIDAVYATGESEGADNSEGVEAADDGEGADTVANSETAETADATDGAETVERYGATETVEVAVRGRLLDADGERITGFVDVFAFEDGAVQRLETYTR